MVRAQLVWEDVDSLPVLAANQFLVQLSVIEPQITAADVVLTVGYLAPPVFLGTPEEQQQAAASVDRLAVRPVGRFSIPLAKAGELARIIQDLLQRAEAARQQP
jgi:hypothetical protein